jgi:hypothetical protein
VQSWARAARVTRGAQQILYSYHVVHMCTRITSVTTLVCLNLYGWLTGESSAVWSLKAPQETRPYMDTQKACLPHAAPSHMGVTTPNTVLNHPPKPPDVCV